MKIKQRVKLLVCFLLFITLTLSISEISATSDSMSKPYSEGDEDSTLFSSATAQPYWGKDKASSCDPGFGAAAWAYIGALDSFGSSHQFTISADCVLKAYGAGSVFGAAILYVYFEIRDAENPNSVLWYQKSMVLDS